MTATHESVDRYLQIGNQRDPAAGAQGALLGPGPALEQLVELGAQLGGRRRELRSERRAPHLLAAARERQVVVSLGQSRRCATPAAELGKLAEPMDGSPPGLGRRSRMLVVALAACASPRANVRFGSLYPSKRSFDYAPGIVSWKDPLAIGFDVVVLDGERIRHVVGFLDKVPG